MGSVSNVVSQVVEISLPAQPHIVATYSYEDRFGEVQYQVVRYEPKDFRQRRPDGNGGYIWNLDGIERIPYRLPELLGSSPDPVFIPEGEKDVERLREVGLTATTNAGGANADWTPQMAQFVAGRDCIVLADNDAVGLLRAEQVCRALHGIAKTIKLLWLPGPDHSDVSDFLDAGHTIEDFHTRVSETPFWLAPEASASASGDGWPEPLDLRPELPPVPTFDINWLPECLRPLVEEVAEGMQIPTDFPAAAITVALAGVSGRRVCIRPKYADESWKEPAVLWGCVIAPPGSLKTPALARIVAPLVAIEAEWRAAEKLDHETYETAKANIAVEQSLWESEVKAAIRDNKPRPPRPDSTICEPGKRRILVTDATYESLHVILSDNPAGVFCTRDELSGFLAGLEADNRQAERPFWLSLWTGSGHFDIDRIGRGHIHVPHVCGSLFGNLVPTSAARLVTSMATGRQDDGFLQRLSFAVWPDIGSWKYIDRPTDPSAAQRWEQIVRSIVALSGLDPLVMNFCSIAQQIFIDWYTNLQLKIRSDALHPAMQGHLAKFSKALVTIAAVFQLAEMADRGKLASHAAIVEPFSERVRPTRCIKLPPEPNQLPPAPVESTPISVQNIQRAISVVSYLEAHAHRLYSCVSTPQLAASHNLARHLRRGDLEKFSKRDIQRRNWTGLQEPELIEAALQHLADLHWIRPVPAPTTEKGGRPTIQYEVNPKVKR